jgi:hypothetical protein
MLAYIFLTFSKVATLLRWLLFGIILIIIVSISQNYLKESSKPSYLTQVLYYENKVTSGLDKNINKLIPTSIGNKNITKLISVLLLLIAASYLKTLAWKLDYWGKYIRYKKMVGTIKQQYVASGKGEDINHLESRLDDLLNSKSKKDSVDIFENFIKFKEKMEHLSRDMTFLSVDVVNSTGMKRDEDKLLVQYDFAQYKKMLQKIFDKYEAIKTAWTPDGVMIAFEKPKNAINAAKEIFHRLDKFNKEEKKIEEKFTIRCGINGGIVYFDSTIPLEEITDQVIDIAGHMQKHADPGTIYVSKFSAEPLAKQEQLVLTDKVIDEVEVYMWEKFE